jgi:hypothetical protein
MRRTRARGSMIADALAAIGTQDIAVGKVDR